MKALKFKQFLNEGVFDSPEEEKIKARLGELGLRPKREIDLDDPTSWQGLHSNCCGAQFNLNYDNTALKFEKVDFTTKGNPTNFGTDRGTYVTLGSLITDGSSTLDKMTEYKITFIPKVGIQGILGLTSISNTDAVNKNGTQLVEYRFKLFVILFIIGDGVCHDNICDRYISYGKFLKRVCCDCYCDSSTKKLCSYKPNN